MPRPAPLALAAAIVAATALPASAFACSCARPPDAKAAAEASALVADATLVSGPELIDGMHHYTFRVGAALKGEPGETIVVQTRTNGAACGRQYADGGRYLIYATAFEGGIAIDNLCTRTTPWESARDDVAALGGSWEDTAAKAPAEGAAPEPAEAVAGEEPAAAEPAEEPAAEPAEEPAGEPAGEASGEPAATGTADGCSVVAAPARSPVGLLLVAGIAGRRRR